MERLTVRPVVAFCRGFSGSAFSSGQALTFKTPDQGPDYPGQHVSSPHLFKEQRVGPTILAGLLALGTKVQDYVRDLYRSWTGPNASQSARSEAVNVARVTHLLILTIRCPQRALIQHPALEVILRRLFALLQFERLVFNDNFKWAEAWEVASEVLEHTPMAHVQETAL